jgi:RNA polymerase sigma-70 factor (ECF subfamily)
VIDTFAPLIVLAQPEDTVIALKSNDGNAYKALFKEFYSPLCRYANSILDDPDEAKDVVQKVFIEIWDKRSILEIKVSVKSYLFRSVHNRCLNVIKTKKRFNREIEIGKMELFAHGADEEFKHTELEKRIEEAMNKLPDQCGRIFYMSRFDRMKYSEIAVELGLSIKTIENQMGKALKILRFELSDYLNLILICFLIK